ncbi:hypothetical protein [Streptomyces sp. NPDC049040]|uniref:hypothetical protein n=1 Tax=Streptomyces sp. NPDC049040 TaxID=3365593 RepID=UPI003710EFB0
MGRRPRWSCRRAALERATRGLSGRQRALLLALLAVLRESAPDAPKTSAEG